MEAAKNSSKDWRERRYLRVTTERIDGCDGPTRAYLVECPRRGQVALDVCVACPESGRIRNHQGGRGPLAIECTYVVVPGKPSPLDDEG